MNFRTPVPIDLIYNKVSHATKTVMLGSCFAENIGERLQNAKFSVDLNPFGILYNPLSVEKAVHILLEKGLFKASDLIEHAGSWHSFMHHSRFSANNADDCLLQINERIADSAIKLLEADYLFITFGTAWVYELQETGEVVSNCHKLPASNFMRRRLSVNEIVEKYTLLIKKLQELSPKLQIVFTVSPIRHWKDGAHENSLSKSTLMLAIDALEKQFENVSYFPAYELMMDDLRDYRFYAEDMLHPNKLAVDYIWERFSDAFFTDETKQTASQMGKLMRALAHRPFNTDGAEYKSFCKKQLDKIKNFEKQYPEINFQEDKDLVARRAK